MFDIPGNSHPRLRVMCLNRVEVIRDCPRRWMIMPWALVQSFMHKMRTAARTSNADDPHVRAKLRIAPYERERKVLVCRMQFPASVRRHKGRS